MLRIFSCFLILFFAVTATAEPKQPLKVSPQFVVAELLSEGRQAKEVTLNAEQSEVALHRALAIFDLSLNGSTSYEYNKSATLSGIGNLEDKTTVWKVGLAKKTPTGTTIGLGYTRTRQDSVFRPNSTSSRPPNVYLDDGQFSITQDLLGNFFGIVDRANVNVARRNVEQADLLKKENLEDLVLQGVRLFWQTYVAKETLRESLAARDKYATLVKDVERRSHLGFTDPGDLPKARAEYEGQASTVKQASLDYLQLTDQLFTLLNRKADQYEIQFVADRELPPVPNLARKDSTELRKVQAGTIALENAAVARKVAGFSGLPTLQFVGAVDYTGLETTRGQAFATMTSGVSPKVSVALQMTYNLFSEGTRATIQEQEINYMLQEVTLSRTKDELTDTLKAAAEKVQATRSIAENSTRALKFWEETVRARERSYRQGKVDFSQLILDYDSYYKAQSLRTKAIGDYNIALNEFAAANDHLIE